jgi:hypothetical protein
MLLRFAVENIMSFKNAVEFNTFPSSKSHSHEGHKVSCGSYVTALRMSAIYGANGAGKSNLLKCIALLKSLVGSDKMGDVEMTEDLYFKLDESRKQIPSELAVEFFVNGRIFYYHIRFNRQMIFEEELFLSQKSKDVLIFSRKGNDMNVSGDYLLPSGKGDFSEFFMDAMTRIVRPDMLALSFFGKYYPAELPMVKEAYDWIRGLEVVLPTMRIGYLPHVLDGDSEFVELVNSIISTAETGIAKLKVRKEVLNDEDVQGNSSLTKVVALAKEHPGAPQVLLESQSEISNIVFEEGSIYIKTLVTIHIDNNGEEVEMNMKMESDGTRRLIEYMPLLYSVLKRDKVFVVDEIERSIHPIMIKTLMRKISENREAKGQIIFTTHESCLLDQSIFRPDEIWFAQKDVEQSTQLYPLSDYNIHKTANIENGYLSGRYGGIPDLPIL